MIPKRRFSQFVPAVGLAFCLLALVALVASIDITPPPQKKTPPLQRQEAIAHLYGGRIWLAPKKKGKKGKFAKMPTVHIPMYYLSCNGANQAFWWVHLGDDVTGVQVAWINEPNGWDVVINSSDGDVIESIDVTYPEGIETGYYYFKATSPALSPHYCAEIDSETNTYIYDSTLTLLPQNCDLAASITTRKLNLTNNRYDLTASAVVTGTIVGSLTYAWTLTDNFGNTQTSNDAEPTFTDLFRDRTYTLALVVTDESESECSASDEVALVEQPEYELIFPDWIALKHDSDTLIPSRLDATSGSEARYQYSGTGERIITISGATDLVFEEMMDLRAFYHITEGIRAFRYLDQHQYQFENEVIGTGDGTTKIFQLVKTLSVQGRTVTRTIRCPKHGNNPLYFWNGVAIPWHAQSYVRVFLDGVEKTNGADFGVDVSSGRVFFTVAPSVGVEITATGEYYHRMAFDAGTDGVGIREKAGGTYDVEGDIQLVEVIA